MVEWVVAVKRNLVHNIKIFQEGASKLRHAIKCMHN